MTGHDLSADAIVDPALFTDPTALHGLLARLRHDDPMPYIDTGVTRPFRLVTRHADIAAIELRTDHFANQPRQAILPLAYERAAAAATGGEGYQAMMRNLVAMDGREHRLYRQITQGHFLSKALNAIREDIDRLAAEFVDRMAALNGSCDFALEIATWFPLRVIMTILGVPQQDEAEMLVFTQQVLSSQDLELATQRDGSISVMMRMFEYFQPRIAALRRNPTGTIGSVIANARVDGQLLPDRDVFGYFLILATAGHDTTGYCLAGGLLALIEHPDQLAVLRTDPAMIGPAVDEIVRWTSPVRHFARTAVQDGEIAGVAYQAGDCFMLSYPSANRDAAVFDDPFAFRVARRPNRHIAFGTGPHLCLGQHLAKMELAAFFRELLPRLSGIELAGAPRWTESTFVGGVKNLPVRYTLLDRKVAAS